MRYSSFADRPGFAAWSRLQARGKIVKTYLDGVLQEYVIAADDEKGLVVVHKTDENGELIVVDREIVTEERYGHVTFEIADFG